MAAAAGQPPGESVWDPFAPPAAASSSSSHPAAPTAQTSTAVDSSSSRSRDSSALQSGSPAAGQQQQQQPVVQPGNKLTLQELRQQLDELSFSQLSQQQGTRFVQQQGARLELLEQLSRQQQVLQKHYSLPKNYQVHIPLSPKPPRPLQPQQQQQQQQLGLGQPVYRQQSLGGLPVAGRGPVTPSQVSCGAAAAAHICGYQLDLVTCGAVESCGLLDCQHDWMKQLMLFYYSSPK
jgi:hypothetical protein